MTIGINASSVIALKSGLSFYIVNLIEAMAKIDRQHRFVVFCKKSEASTFGSLPENTKVVANAPASNILRLLWEQTILPFVLCRKYKITTLFSPNYTCPVFKPGFYSVVAFHDSSFFAHGYLFAPARRIFKHIIRVSTACADRVIAVSGFTKQDIERHLKLKDTNKIAVVYNAAHSRFNSTPLSQDQILAIREKYKLNGRYILFSGLYEPRKNIPRLIQAFSMICDRVKENLAIAGGGGWWQNQVLEAYENSPAKERIILLGYVQNSDLPALYKEATLFAFPTLYEGFGISALESVACGTPVLASDNSSLPEVVGHAGVYVDPFNVSDIAEKLSAVLTNPTLLAELKSKCAEQAAKFSWEKCAKETLACLHATGAHDSNIRKTSRKS